jgi:CDP-diacylglycerol---serine O-phosphatidyltransferase
MRAPVDDLHVSNLLTYGGIAAAVGAMAAARGEDGLAISGALLAVAAVLDAFDGRFARRFERDERQRRIGGQIDSLADAMVFGVAPVVVLAALPDAPSRGVASWIWWSAAFVYLVASVTRLGFFTVEDDQTRFVGVPTPAIALVWSTALLARPAPWLVTALFVVCAALMVGRISIPRPRGPGLAVFVLWAIGLLAAHGLKS